MEQVVNAVLEAMLRSGLVQVEVSARHVHLSAQDLVTLFGPGAALTAVRPLSQPGQFLAGERVTVIGPKGRFERTAILGPVRGNTQVELAISDLRVLGITAPMRESGDVQGSSSVTIEGPCGQVTLQQGVIIARNHIHMTPDAARTLALADKQKVSVKVLTDRPITFHDVIVRVSDKFSCRVHLDTDEGNAAAVSGFTLGMILR
ncbi:MAG: phosphate propanoyltransferase [Clostridia bacterium]|nr:phosphate propanoyltransferase [Clostridia bacterium]